MTNNIIEFIEFQLRRKRIHKIFRKSSGLNGNFENPVSYEEKIQFRKLYGNSETYASIADKWKVREFVK